MDSPQYTVKVSPPLYLFTLLLRQFNNIAFNLQCFEAGEAHVLENMDGHFNRNIAFIRLFT